MMQIIELKNVRPASYNPRKLTESAFEDLKESITTLGVIKPIIVRKKDMLILAGHQRTKTMLALGIETAPAFVLDGVNSSDEVRFNQLHNITEAEVSERAPVVALKLKEGSNGFITVKNADIRIIQMGEEGHKIALLSKMIMKYGEFASVVCDADGVVLVSAIYALAAKLCGKDLLAYVLPRGLEQKCIEFFAKDYGQFCYETIERKTYMQSFAQKFRLRKSSKDKTKEAGHSKSTLYESCVIPYIKKDMRVLDFGAGQKDYATHLKRLGYNIDAIEFYHRTEGTNAIDVAEIRKDCRTICEHLERYGLYDVVVCYSVLNSVDSVEAERAVLSTISALCKPGGVIFWSGIPRMFIENRSALKNSTDTHEYVRFIDADGFTANFNHGEWFFQKYHSLADIERVTRENIGEIVGLYDGGALITKMGEPRKSSFQVRAKNTHPRTREELLEAARFEFSLPLPNGNRWDLDKDIMPILSRLISE